MTDEELSPAEFLAAVEAGLYAEWPFDVEIHCLEWLREDSEDEHH